MKTRDQLPGTNSWHWKTRILWVGLGLAIITFVLYLPTVAYSWVNFDDNDYVTENPHVSSGLRWSNLGWAFTHFHAAYWIPATWISHMIDCHLWGFNPGPPHLVNAAFHSLNTALLFFLLYFMTGALWRAAMVASLFAWHPLHVESVAWLAGRKDVLSTMFWLLATLCYSEYARDRRVLRYLAATSFFILGLMAKPSLVSWPVTLLLLDVWPLGRLQIRGKPFVTSERPDSRAGAQPATTLIYEKIPLLLISAIFSVLTFRTQSAGGAISSLQQFSILFRLENAVLSYGRYLLKTIWPTNLIAFYPLPQTISLWQVAVSALFLAAVTGFTIYQMKSRPYLAIGWFWYLSTMVPMIGLLQAGGQAMADRFAYVPLIGVFVIIVWGFSELTRTKWGRRVVIAGAAIALATCLCLSVIQMKQWKDPIALFSRMLAIAGPINIAHDHLGAALYQQGKMEQAIQHFRSAIDLNPRYPDAHNNLATALFQTGERQEAFRHFREALRLDPNYARARNNYGNALLQEGQVTEAIVQYQRALQTKPDYLMAHNNLGAALLKLGRKEEAIEQFQQALELQPDFKPAQDNLLRMSEDNPQR